MNQQTNERWRTEIDQQMGVLSTEVSGIKTQLRDQGQMLGKIFSRLDEISGRQGPGVGEMLKIVLAGGGIVSLAAASITVLVTSFVSPSITKLETQGQHHNAVVSQLLEERISEFNRLKKAEAERVEDRLRKLERQVASGGNGLAWAPQIKAD